MVQNERFKATIAYLAKEATSCLNAERKQASFVQASWYFGIETSVRGSGCGGHVFVSLWYHEKFGEQDDSVMDGRGVRFFL